MESIKTKLLVALIFSIISLVAWLGAFLYFMSIFLLIESNPYAGLFAGYLTSMATTYAVAFLILMCVSAIVVKRIHDMYNAANSKNVERLKQLNSLMWSVIALVFSGIVPGIMLLLALGQINNLAADNHGVTETPKPNAVDSLMKFKTQLDSGSITENEFKAKKEQLLNDQLKNNSNNLHPKELVSEHHRNLETHPGASQSELKASASTTVESPLARESTRAEQESVPRQGNLERNGTIPDQPKDSTLSAVPWEHFERLWKLKTLLDSQVITKDEFETQKNKLLQGKAEKLLTDEAVKSTISTTMQKMPTSCPRSRASEATLPIPNVKGSHTNRNFVMCLVAIILVSLVLMAAIANFPHPSSSPIPLTQQTQTQAQPQTQTAVPVYATTEAQSTFERAYGGNGDDLAYSVHQTSDGGYIVAGVTNFQIGPESASADVWVLKLDSAGIIQWQNTYGGTGVNEAHSIQQTSDGGYIVAGSSGTAAWVLKLGPDGSVQWQKTYTFGSGSGAYSVQQTSDGGYIVGGVTYVSPPGNDVWVLKLGPDGSVQWQKTYGGSSDDYAMSVQQTKDGGYITAGWMCSMPAGNCNFWVVSLDSAGTIQWQKSYGGTGDDRAYSIQQTSDGGYVVVGETSSFRVASFLLPTNAWVLKLGLDGSVQWQKTYSGGMEADSVQQTSDSGYIVAGWTTVSAAPSAFESWVMKLDSAGTIQWQKTYGFGNGDDEARSVQQTSDGGYIVAGWTSFGNSTGDPQCTTGTNNAQPTCDIWLLKLDSNGSISSPYSLGVSSSATAVDTNATPITTDATVTTTTATVVCTNVTGIPVTGVKFTGGPSKVPPDSRTNGVSLTWLVGIKLRGLEPY